MFKSLALAASALAFAACGGGADSAPADSAASTPAATPATTPASGPVALAPATGTTHEIKMVGDEKGYRFEPANLTIKSGDAVKYTFVSGGPHNVAFHAPELSADVKAQLDANFGADRLAELMSNMYNNPGEGFTLSFGNIPAGTYNFNCTPHIAMNMTGIITVE